MWDREGLSQLPADSGKKISDLIALNIGTIGENMAVRRGVFFRVPSSALVGCYAHGKLLYYYFSHVNGAKYRLD